MIGSVLPLRAALRSAQRRRSARRRDAMLARGVPLRVSDPAIERLVAAYDDLLLCAPSDDLTVAGSSIAAAHGAVMEVATLIRGRHPGSEKELEYTKKRTTAIEELTAAARARRHPRPPAGTIVNDVDRGSLVDPETVIEAREELDALGGMNSLTRLEEIAAEVKDRGYG